MCESMSQCFPSTPPNTSFCYLSFKVLSRFSSPPSRFLKLKVWLVVCVKPNVTMNNPKRNTTVVTSGWNRCFEHVFPPKKKNLVDANHLPRECSSAFGNHWPGWPSGIRALCLFWDKNLSFKRKALFVKSLGQQKWILLIFVAQNSCRDHTEPFLEVIS